MATFPQELHDLVALHLNRDRAVDPSFYLRAKGDTLVRHLYQKMEGVGYGFQDNLITGQYALYAPEMRALNVSGYNCTTVVPTMYVYAQQLGLNPQIVQFFNFKDLRSYDDPEREDLSSSHFSLILSKDTKRYLFDPFYHVAAPILEESSHSFRLGKTNSTSKVLRTFEEKVEYSEDDFASMMFRFKEEGTSLDMLICGQRLFRKWEVHASPVSGMVYFKEPNEVCFRFEIPQMGIRSKVVMMRQIYDLEKSAWNTSVELYLARDCNWDSMVDPILVGAFTPKEMKNLRRSFSKMGKVERFPRYSQSFEEHPDVASCVLRDATFSLSKLGKDQLELLLPLLRMRYGYEECNPLMEYLYPLEKRASFYVDAKARETSILRDGLEVGRKMNLHDASLLLLDSTERRRLRSKLLRLKSEQDIVSKEVDSYVLYKGKNLLYHRTMDKVLFAQEHAQDVNNLVLDEKKLAMAYGATVADFIPYIHSLRDYLSFSAYREMFERKIITRALVGGFKGLLESKDGISVLGGTIFK